MPLGPIEAAGFFAIVLTVAIIELFRTRALMKQDRTKNKSSADKA